MGQMGHHFWMGYVGRGSLPVNHWPMMMKYLCSRLVACNFLFLVDFKKLLTHSNSHPIITAGGLILIYDVLLSRSRGLSSTTMPCPLLVPCVVSKWCNGHGSWVMGHERWSISISAFYRCSSCVHLVIVWIPLCIAYCNEPYDILMITSLIKYFVDDSFERLLVTVCFRSLLLSHAVKWSKLLVDYVLYTSAKFYAFFGSQWQELFRTFISVCRRERGG